MRSSTFADRILTAAAAAVLAVCAAAAPLGARAGTVTVFAAASLKTALDGIAAEWAGQSGNTAVVSFAGSSELARQIAQGAPADIFISANPGWMDFLETGGFVAEGTRSDLLGNSMVLIAHGRDAPPVEIVPGFDLAGMLGDGRLAMALVDAVPAGIYGKAALSALGVWDAVAPKVAQADNVRAALAFVSTGEAPMGIVYASDAVADASVSVIGTFPAETHPPVIYPVAAIAGRDNPLTGGFLEFLRSDAARAIFGRQGFTLPGE